MTKCLIFDLDGTLIRLPIRYETLQKNLQNFFHTENNLSPLIPSIINQAKNDQNVIDDAFKIVCDEELIAAKTLEEIEGLHDVMKYVTSTNYTISLVTMQCKRSLDVILKKLNLEENFSSILTRDDYPDRFLQIQKTCESLNFVPSDVTMIGDRIHDINSANQANCKSILVNRDDIDSKKLIELITIL
ncbi:HAD family hydrolase [Candidatus Nitrosopelagicus sp.]|nr:HAD family hydrolase [Candidatus Nitrosopelagicus sp.]